jgi:glutamate carboxypeptidase
MSTQDLKAWRSAFEVLSWLDDQADAMVQLVRQLAEINSGSTHLPGLARVAQVLVEEFSGISDSSERLDLEPWEGIDDAGQHVKIPLGQSLRFQRNMDAQRKVWLGIHYDTVYGPEHLFQSCHWLDTGTLNGPGVADAKGGIVVLLFALRALAQSSLNNLPGWEVYLNPDEELGSPGAGDYFKQCAPLFDFGMLFEPSLPDGSLAYERKGSGNFTIVLRGKSVHAGRDFYAGRNAVVRLAQLADQMNQLNGKVGGSTLNVARMVGGGPSNIVPDLAVARLNVRVDNGENQKTIQQLLEQWVAQVNQEDGFQCELFGRITSPPKLPDAAIEQMRGWVEVLGEAVGEKISWANTGGVCDGNKLFAAGLPNLDTLGPRGGEIHSSREFLDVTSLVPRAKLAAGLMIVHGLRAGGLLGST